MSEEIIEKIILSSEIYTKNKIENKIEETTKILINDNYEKFNKKIQEKKETIKELEQEIKTSALPKAVTDYCTKNYAGYKLSEAAKITDADGKVMYEAEMEKDKMQFDALFDANGNFVKKTEATKEEEGKD